MKTFWNYNEDDGIGADLIGPLALLSETVTLWAPSSQYVSNAFNQGKTRIDKKGLVELVDQGIVRISARESWILNGESRQKLSGPQWQYDTYFDREIESIYKHDQVKTAGNRRVFALPPERGTEIARKDREERSTRFLKALDYLNQGRVSTGAKRRIKELTDIGNGIWATNVTAAAAEQVIKDSVNHVDALNGVNSDVAVELDNSATGAVYDIAERQEDIETSPQPFSKDLMLSAIDFVRRWSGKETAQDIIKLREDKYERIFLSQLLRAERDFDRLLAEQIEAGHNPKSVLRDMLGNDFANFFIQTTGAGMSFWSILPLILSKGVEQNPLMGLAGLGLTAAPALLKTMVRTSFREDSSYNGPRFVFVGRYGTWHPKWNQITEILKELKT